MVVAHKKKGPDGSDVYESLESHCRLVAQLAKRFARAFHASTYAYDTGLNHDGGKNRRLFQKYIREGGKRGSVTHSRVGAYAAYISGDDELVPMAMCINGHHGALPPLHGWYGDLTWVREAEREHREAVKAGFKFRRTSKFKFLDWIRGYRGSPQFALGVFTRMLYSCLVDADWLCTELWMDRSRYTSRYTYDDLEELLKRHRRYMAALRARAPKTLVNKMRSLAHRACCLSSYGPRGIYSLEMPTGTGKTLAGMSFALRHALKNRQKRVIVVIPYCGIIEQTAEEYRKIFGAGNVVEHHTARDPAVADEAHERMVENWDAPIVVTTFVQFIESLFAHYRSRCRKIHNIADSVIILDEVQTLPKRMLAPILETLRLLVSKFGCTLVFSTATQPAFARRDGFDIGLDGIRPIIKVPRRLFDALRRVNVKYIRKAVTWKRLARAMMADPQVLAIVNTKKDALRLASVMPSDTFFLSGYMPPVSRSEVIRTVKSLLREGKPCRLISTQVVEAGVDIDFPVLYRVEAPYDSIVQSSGRCNREGAIESGRMYVVRVVGSHTPDSTYDAGIGVFREMMLSHGGRVDIYDPATYEEYYSKMYRITDLDRDGLLGLQETLDFAEVNRRCRVIDAGLDALIIPLDEESREAINALRSGVFNRDLLRKLQRYSVNIWDEQRDEWLGRGLIYPLFSKPKDSREGVEDKIFYILRDEALAVAYDQRLGLIPDKMPSLLSLVM